MSDELSLVLGGARSGKSRFAERLAVESGRPVLYVATAEPLDDEMRQRIAAHRQRRPAAWRTLEATRAIASAIAAGRQQGELVLVEDLCLLTSNYLLAAGGEAASSDALRAAEAALWRDLDELCTLEGPVVVVSNEVGMGVVPPFPLGRLFRDLLGLANQRMAERAERVYFLVAGVPIAIKGG